MNGGKAKNGGGWRRKLILLLLGLALGLVAC